MSLINKLPEIFQNRTKIWEGLRNKIFKQEHVEDVYKVRLEICKTCENYDTDGVGCTIPGTAPCCNEKTGGCGCSLSLKLRSLSSDCPLKKWTAIVSEQDEELINKQIHDKGQG